MESKKIVLLVDKTFSQSERAFLANAIFQAKKESCQLVFMYSNLGQFANKIALKLFGFRPINIASLLKASLLKNSIIIFFKPNWAPKWFLKIVKTRGNKLVWYSGDNPSKKWNQQGFGKSNITHFDFYLTIAIESYEDYFRKNSFPFRSYLKANDRTQYLSAKHKSSCDMRDDVLFIGTRDNERIHFFEQMQELGIQFTIYGNGWASYKNRIPFHNVMGAELNPAEISNIVSEHKFALNILRWKNNDTHNTKSFELPLGKTLVITDHTDTHVKLYGDGIFLNKSRTPQSYASIIQHYRQNEEQYQTDRLRQNTNFENSNRTYAQWANEILNDLKLTK